MVQLTHTLLAQCKCDSVYQFSDWLVQYFPAASSQVEIYKCIYAVHKHTDIMHSGAKYKHSLLWIMDLTSDWPINPAQVWVYFSWTNQTTHEIRIPMTDSLLNNKLALSLSKTLSWTAVQINPGNSTDMQAIMPCDRYISLTALTGVTCDRTIQW